MTYYLSTVILQKIEKNNLYSKFINLKGNLRTQTKKSQRVFIKLIKKAVSKAIKMFMSFN